MLITKNSDVKCTLILFLEADKLDALRIGKEMGNNGNHADVEGVLIAKIEGFFSRSLFFSTGMPKLANCVEDGSKQPNNI